MWQMPLVYRFLKKAGKKRATMGTELMTILPAVLLVLFVLILLAALVSCLERLNSAARTHDEVTTGAQRQQSFLKTSDLHILHLLGMWR